MVNALCMHELDNLMLAGILWWSEVFSVILELFVEKRHGFDVNEHSIFWGVL
jgi:hypothetical protein